jgi:hypothetical protein
MADNLGVTVERDDESGFITADGATVTVVGFYSTRGSTKPYYTSDPGAWTAEYGNPDASISYAGYSVRKPLEQGDGVWNLRITDSATYGGAFVTAGTTSVSKLPFLAAGWPYSIDDVDTAINPTRPLLIQLKFSAALITANSFTCTLVGESAQVSTTPVVFATDSDTTMGAIVAAIQSSMDATFGAGGTVSAGETTLIRTINVIPPAGKTISITGAAVTLGASQATVTQGSPLLIFQHANPGSTSDELGYFLSNPDLGQREVVTLTFPSALSTGHGTLVTVNGAATSSIVYATSSDATMQAIADAVAALATVKSATVTKVASGASNDRTITIILKTATATAATVSTTQAGGAPVPVIKSTKPGVDPDGSFTLAIFDRRNPAVTVDSWRVNLTERLDGDGVQQHIEEVINKGDAKSRLLRVISLAPKDGSVRIPFDPDTGVIMTQIAYLSAGNNGVIPSAAKMADAMLVFQDPYRYPADLMISAGYTSIAYQQALKNIAKLRGDGTFAILDIPSTQQSFDNLINYRLSTLAIDDSSAGAYYPDVEMQDPVTQRKLFVPPSGHIAAVFGVNDRVRGFGKAPAGRKVGVVDTTALRYEYTQAQVTLLAENYQLNGILKKGVSWCVWGDFTLQVMKSALQFTGISRLVGKLEFAIADMLDFDTFDPFNDAQAFSMREKINRFLAPYIKSEDLRGYTVNTGSTAGNTAALEDQGARIVEMKLNPTRSTRKIKLRSIITAAGVETTVTEVA